MKPFCNGAPEKLPVPVCPGHIGSEHVSALAAELLAVCLTSKPTWESQTT